MNKSISLVFLLFFVAHTFAMQHEQDWQSSKKTGSIILKEFENRISLQFKRELKEKRKKSLEREAFRQTRCGLLAWLSTCTSEEQKEIKKTTDPDSLYPTLKRTLLHIAVAHNYINVVFQLIDLGWDVNTKDKYDNVPLDLALVNLDKALKTRCSSECVTEKQIVVMLKAAGAVPNREKSLFRR